MAERTLLFSDSPGKGFILSAEVGWGRFFAGSGHGNGAIEGSNNGRMGAAKRDVNGRNERLIACGKGCNTRGPGGRTFRVLLPAGAGAGKNNPASVDALTALELDGTKLSDLILDQTGKIGEKIGVSKFETVSGEKVIAYIHGNYRLGVLVALSADAAGAEEAGKDVAMQIAAMNPVAIDKGDVDSRTIERELEIAKEQIRAEGKPEEMVEKIAAGKLNKFYKDSTLLNQEFVKDSSKSVAQFLSTIEKGLTVTAFKRVALGA